MTPPAPVGRKRGETQPDTHTREKAEDGSPRDRASELAAPVLEISASLDVDTVVRRVVEGAQGLTGARRGIIATIDESGAPGEFLLSGYTPEEQRELLAWPHSLQLFEHFHELPGPLRQGDFAGYARTLDLTPLASFSLAFQDTPMRHRGMSIGYCCLGGKAGGEACTDADEEVLVQFASQAAAAIANARAHRSEQRARRELKALIETSPVGLVVLDDICRASSTQRLRSSSTRTTPPASRKCRRSVLLNASGYPGSSDALLSQSDHRNPT